MKPSTERILTTHVGSLARADSLIPLLRLRENGQPYDREELARLVREAVADVVRKQVEAGIDIVWPWLKFAALAEGARLATRELWRG
jgi:5-methyltetrahydropteroyltriglutamate--homocysteine methyltransferase